MRHTHASRNHRGSDTIAPEAAAERAAETCSTAPGRSLCNGKIKAPAAHHIRTAFPVAQTVAVRSVDLRSRRLRFESAIEPIPDGVRLFRRTWILHAYRGDRLVQTEKLLAALPVAITDPLACREVLAAELGVEWAIIYFPERVARELAQNREAEVRELPGAEVLDIVMQCGCNNVAEPVRELAREETNKSTTFALHLLAHFDLAILRRAPVVVLDVAGKCVSAGERGGRMGGGVDV
eukprot:CAMPEP_0185384104 /NCGR_PEP_ID=MMETSP1364-20130426/59149_1 /TAXON_ID=38817 /ORGANISM="Gephyrocapsa oceanica, Strain RCC1303" /LENGTH=236 /DNA_ID=CAMNT_0027985859 /DNA_START=615 /DNA_END=1326 /DNA_ORIENTATION=+